MKFQGFTKIARYSREVVVTEKIDGTNAQIYIGEDGEFLTGSRNRWITPDDDNYGFSRWAHDHKEDLLTLGTGRFYGEWWGSGCQRGYGLKNGEKRFSLFNTSLDASKLPSIVRLVPVLWHGNFDLLNVYAVINDLKQSGSIAEPGYMNPEGIVIYHVASGMSFKKTIYHDDEPKGRVKAEKSIGSP